MQDAFYFFPTDSREIIRITTKPLGVLSDKAMSYLVTSERRDFDLLECFCSYLTYDMVFLSLRID